MITVKRKDNNEDYTMFHYFLNNYHFNTPLTFTQILQQNQTDLSKKLINERITIEYNMPTKNEFDNDRYSFQLESKNLTLMDLYRKLIANLCENIKQGFIVYDIQMVTKRHFLPEVDFDKITVKLITYDNGTYRFYLEYNKVYDKITENRHEVSEYLV